VAAAVDLLWAIFCHEKSAARSFYTGAAKITVFSHFGRLGLDHNALENKELNLIQRV
jgi:hypothetical protein